MRIPSTPLRMPRSPVAGMLGGTPGVRVSMSLDQFKGMFFREDRVLQKMDRATYRAFSKFGARVRLTARHSLRKKKAGVYAKPMHPPYSHGRHLLRNFILYGMPPDQSHVVIGPALLLGSGLGLGPYGSHTVPQVQEFGGSVLLRKSGKKRGPGRQMSFTYTSPDGHTAIRVVKPIKLVGGKLLAYDGKAKPPGMRTFAVSRMDDVSEYVPLKQGLMGPMPAGRRNRRRYHPRPYMGPAFRRELPKAQDLWANSVK